MDAAPIVAKIEEIQREMEGRFDQLGEGLDGLRGDISGLNRTTAGIIEFLTDLAEHHASKAEILAKLRDLA
jgi:hypothetical protein